MNMCLLLFCILSFVFKICAFIDSAALHATDSDDHDREVFRRLRPALLFLRSPVLLKQT